MRKPRSTSNTTTQTGAIVARQRASSARHRVSADTELVAFGVRHHHVATGELLKCRRAGNRQPFGHLGYPCPPLIDITTVGDPNVQMQPVLGDFRFWHPLKEQPRPDSSRVS
jgi:hypothetical protein